MTLSPRSHLITAGLIALAVVLVLLLAQPVTVISPLNAQAPASNAARPTGTFSALVPAVLLQETPTPAPPTDTPEPPPPPDATNTSPPPP